MAEATVKAKQNQRQMQKNIQKGSWSKSRGIKQAESEAKGETTQYNNMSSTNRSSHGSWPVRGLHSLTSNVGRAGSMVNWVGSSLGAPKHCTKRNELRCTRISLTCLLIASLTASLLYFLEVSLNFMHNLRSEEHMTLCECRYFLGDQPTILRTFS